MAVEHKTLGARRPHEAQTSEVGLGSRCPTSAWAPVLQGSSASAATSKDIAGTARSWRAVVDTTAYGDEQSPHVVIWRHEGRSRSCSVLISPLGAVVLGCGLASTRRRRLHPHFLSLDAENGNGGVLVFGGAARANAMPRVKSSQGVVTRVTSSMQLRCASESHIDKQFRSTFQIGIWLACMLALGVLGQGHTARACRSAHAKLASARAHSWFPLASFAKAPERAGDTTARTSPDGLRASADCKASKGSLSRVVSARAMPSTCSAGATPATRGGTARGWARSEGSATWRGGLRIGPQGARRGAREAQDALRPPPRCLRPRGRSAGPSSTASRLSADLCGRGVGERRSVRARRPQRALQRWPICAPLVSLYVHVLVRRRQQG